ncbi:hypothetical protein POJ06DRAFT_292131 [Lipomyces tetrasporus]|uniref:Uncharacterized protein n=1 Tax=Lipomyces tetrasporus TaxID=54092 RepID=A0AAD7VQV7_9ASCO|nr:uncharacterized protein POJ06DRAFT_292131 [Lipomyces tetrasporus]KAJ8098543.1 hypothetical protein POJ06DRAFT_292131 [Lipomyces tetrasporus]
MFTNQVVLGNTLCTVGVIGESFGISNQGQLSWLIAGYSLTIGTFILIGGRLGDGHGPALTLPNGLAILGQSYSPGQRKNISFSWFADPPPLAPLPVSCSAAYSRWLVAVDLLEPGHCDGWRRSLRRLDHPPLPVQPERNRSLRKKLEGLDIPGGLTGVTALLLFNFAWNQVGAAFFCIEVYLAKAPILPLAAFNSDIAFVFACTATGWACFGIWVFYIGQVALNISGTTAVQMAAWFTPVIPSGLISALAVGKLVGKVPASWIMVVGKVAYLVGSILAAARPPHTIYWTYYFFSVFIITVGMDTSFPATAMIFYALAFTGVQGHFRTRATCVVFE